MYNHEYDMRYAFKAISNEFSGPDRFTCIQQMNKWLNQEFPYTKDLVDLDKEWVKTTQSVKLNVIVTYRYQYDAND